jgi:hypothetical protein
LFEEEKEMFGGNVIVIASLATKIELLSHLINNWFDAPTTRELLIMLGDII